MYSTFLASLSDSWKDCFWEERYLRENESGCQGRNGRGKWKGEMGGGNDYREKIDIIIRCQEIGAKYYANKRM